MSNIVKFPNDYVPPEQESLSDLKKEYREEQRKFILTMLLISIAVIF